MWREKSWDRTGWHGERTDYDEGEDARGSLLGHLDGHLKGESSSIEAESQVFCTSEIGCNLSMTSRKRASSCLTANWILSMLPTTIPPSKSLLLGLNFFLEIVGC